MSEQLKCDQCGRVDRAEHVRWLKVEQFGLVVNVLGRHPGPWHFDTPRCLEEWAFSIRTP